MADEFEIKAMVIDAVSEIIDPRSGDSVLEAHILEGLELSGSIVDISLKFPDDYDRNDRWAVEDAVTDAVQALEEITEARVASFTESYDPAAAKAKGEAAQSEAAEPAAEPAAAEDPTKPAQSVTPDALRGVGRVIAVASGKGGVGKSTVAVNLALALKQLGFNVGLLDIDVYGPSLPTLLGINERPSVEEKRIIPLEAEGLKLMSLGFLMDEDTPVIWRGPIVTGIIRQFLQDVDWQGVDYLVVDLPPGTGDAQLSLAQTVPVDGAIVVTTPSDLSLIDAARGLRMFNTLNVDVIGIVENMAYFDWPGGDAVREALVGLPESDAKAAIEAALAEHGKMHIFGSGGGQREAERLETKFLGEIPLDGAVRAGGDAGRPIVVGDPSSPVTAAFLALAQKVTEEKPLDADESAPKKGMFSLLKS
jgi:ATP-binding protein involved in chromosome partitioning